MSGREKQGVDSTAERRSHAARRVQFESLVAVGAADGGNGFEAESMNVSADGMRLRTAYLPAVGDRLVCRFDGLEGEAVVEGEVIWATEQQKGGEFAVRFLDLDDETREMLKELCFAESQGLGDEKPEERDMAGTRVRLHIEGLGSPMKARVRSGNERELMVGSSLEFLKLGRPVELEDVDRQKKREGFVDAVKVEVDPESSIPQLVVSLRFDALPVASAPKTKPGMGPAAKATIAAAPLTEAFVKPATVVAEPSDVPGTVRASDTQAPPADDEEMDFGKSKLRVAGEKAKAFTTHAASAIGPTLNGLGAGAKGVWDKVGIALSKRREKQDEERRENAPRRVTAPPPSGALKSSGRKLVREENSEMDPDSMQIPKNSRKRAMIGAVVGLGLIGGTFGVVKAMSGGSDAKKAPMHAEGETKGLSSVPTGAAMANVPLYGDTPMSTTTPIPVPPTPKAAASARAKGDDDGSDDGQDKASSEVVKEWGHGDVSKAKKAFRIKMDGPLSGITGEEVDGGFIIRVPGHKSTSASSAFAKNDKRLSSVDVVNRDNGAEITVKFKGEAPGYLAKIVKGDKLEIQIGGDAGKTATAKAGKKKGASKASKKAHH